MSLPKVLVWTSIYDKKDYCLEKFLKHAKELTYPNFDHIFIDNSQGLDYTKKLLGMGLTAYHVERGNNTREALARTSNFARQKAIEGNYDYFFSLESDVFCHADTIQRLMSWGKDVVSGWYFIGNKKSGMRLPCITLPWYDERLGAWGTRLLKQEEFPDYLNKGLKQVQAGSFGVCLVHKNVFKKIPFTYDPRFKGHPDIYFYNELWMAKIPSYVDTHCVADHDQGEGWDKVEDR
jgi:hypothetical protein